MPASAEPAVTPTVSPVEVQVSPSVSAARDTRDSTTDIPATSTGAMVSPARKAIAISAGREPTRCSACAATANSSAVPTKRVTSVPGSFAMP